MIFRPFTLTIVYFVYLGFYSVLNPAITEFEWVLLNRFHNLIAVTAGFTFAFYNKPIDKSAVSFLWCYLFLLMCFDWIIPPGYVDTFAFVAGAFIAWLVYRRWTDKILFSGERTGRHKNDGGV